MKRGSRIALSIALVVIAGSFLISRHYRIASLTPDELSLKQPKPPNLPEDCSEIHRAMALSERSLASGHERPIKVASPLDSDETAIYIVLIKQWNAGQTKTLNVSARTSPLGSVSSLEEQGCECLSGLAPESLLKASHSFHVLTANDLSPADIRLVDPEKQMAMVAENDPGRTMHKGISVAEAVENGFAKGLFSLSEIAFDEERRHAVVSYGFHCGMKCGNGATLLFEKVNGKWKETDRTCGGWIS